MRPFCRLTLGVLLFARALHATDIENPSPTVPAPAPLPALPARTLNVGLANEPPFNIHNPDGSWTGISVELWKRIARQTGLKYEFQEVNIPGRFAGLREGWLDATIGPLTITAEREQICDFTHAYFTAGLGVALPAPKPGVGAFFDSGLLSWRFWRPIVRVAAGLFVAAAAVACLLWICERRANAAQFGHGNAVRGIGSALWWAAVTMSTVGYGDVSPRTFRGRALAVAWMFASLVLVSILTASMASVLTAERLTGTVVIRGPEDLRGMRVGTVPASDTTRFLRANRIPFRALTLPALFDALHRHEIDAIVYDSPILRYEVQEKYAGEAQVASVRLETDLYGFALREGSPLREPINRALLEIVREPAWHAVVEQYLGRD